MIPRVMRKKVFRVQRKRKRLKGGKPLREQPFSDGGFASYFAELVVEHFGVQAAAAQRARANQSTLSKIISGRSRSMPSKDVRRWMKVFEAKGVDPREFLEKFILSKLDTPTKALYLEYLALNVRRAPRS